MVEVCPKKAALPAFLGIYSPDAVERSKSFTSGSLSGLEQLRSAAAASRRQQAQATGNGSAALAPTRTKEASPYQGRSPGNGGGADTEGPARRSSTFSESDTTQDGVAANRGSETPTKSRMGPTAAATAAAGAAASAAGGRPAEAWGPARGSGADGGRSDAGAAGPGIAPPPSASASASRVEMLAAVYGGGGGGDKARRSSRYGRAAVAASSGRPPAAGSPLRGGGSGGDPGAGDSGSGSGGEAEELVVAGRNGEEGGGEEGSSLLSALIPKSLIVPGSGAAAAAAAAAAGAAAGAGASISDRGAQDRDLPKLAVRFPKALQLRKQQQQEEEDTGSPKTRTSASISSPLASRASSLSAMAASNAASPSAAAASVGGGGGGGGVSAGRAPGGGNLYRVKWLDFGMNSEQEAVKSAAERVARTVLAKHAANADDTRAFPHDSIAAAGKEGFGGVAVPASAGGMGLSTNDCALAFEALGMGDTSVAGYLTLHNMVAWLVANYATPALQQQVLRGLASTALLAAYAATEPASGSDPAAVATTATPAPFAALSSAAGASGNGSGGGGYVLNGSKVLVAGAGVADVILVLARTSELPTKGLSLFLVNRTTPGLSVGRPERSLGWRSIPLSPVTLSKCAVRADALVGREGQGLELLNAALDQQRVWLSAVSVGGAQLALDYVMQYGKSRKLGTKAVTDMQAVQFRLVDIHSELQAARLLVRSAAQQCDAKAPGRSLAVCMAKQFATETAATVASEVCGLMGGAGMVGEHPPERIARDLRAATVVGGANEQLAGRVFAEMQKMPGGIAGGVGGGGLF
ncbi:hypothetical protein PLESTB_000660100 [Pleodorina starrii]|uniref:Uncharacterized protein n=1 Tax=Pleodorina starrii TaxID=330485 RepID=A0A9W6BIP7_9CHLO|nr:hypothetical protein PLESTM_001320500 [Pleodorina starrii]GLC52713.1 hypothetical protein PLESTB_000660100 [Pleodorina starrii]GLC76934.1 hypothetical protein PLESTF_001857500 [Pleodorina starrii]